MKFQWIVMVGVFLSFAGVLSTAAFYENHFNHGFEEAPGFAAPDIIINGTKVSPVDNQIHIDITAKSSDHEVVTWSKTPGEITVEFRTKPKFTMTRSLAIMRCPSGKTCKMVAGKVVVEPLIRPKR